MSIEAVNGRINRESLSLIGWKHKTKETAERAANAAINDGYTRVVIQTVGAQRLQEGRSMDEDDHWVASPGHEYFVWGDSATHDAKQNAARKAIDAQIAIEKNNRQKHFAELLSTFTSSQYPHFIATGTRMLEDLSVKGFRDLADAAVAAGKTEDLRSAVWKNNENRKA